MAWTKHGNPCCRACGIFHQVPTALTLSAEYEVFDPAVTYDQLRGSTNAVGSGSYPPQSTYPGLEYEWQYRPDLIESLLAELTFVNPNARTTGGPFGRCSDQTKGCWLAYPEVPESLIGRVDTVLDPPEGQATFAGVTTHDGTMANITASGADGELVVVLHYGERPMVSASGADQVVWGAATGSSSYTYADENVIEVHTDAKTAASGSLSFAWPAVQAGDVAFLEVATAGASLAGVTGVSASVHGSAGFGGGAHTSPDDPSDVRRHYGLVYVCTGAETGSITATLVDDTPLTLVGAQSSSAASGAIGLTWPAVEAGDLLILETAITDGQVASLSGFPAGAPTLVANVQDSPSSAPTAVLRHRVYRYTCTGAESGTFTVGFSDDGAPAGRLVAAEVWRHAAATPSVLVAASNSGDSTAFGSAGVDSGDGLKAHHLVRRSQVARRVNAAWEVTTGGGAALHAVVPADTGAPTLLAKHETVDDPESLAVVWRHEASTGDNTTAVVLALAPAPRPRLGTLEVYRNVELFSGLVPRLLTPSGLASVHYAVGAANDDDEVAWDGPGSVSVVTGNAAARRSRVAEMRPGGGWHDPSGFGGTVSDVEGAGEFASMLLGKLQYVDSNTVPPATWKGVDGEASELFASTYILEPLDTQALRYYGARAFRASAGDLSRTYTFAASGEQCVAVVRVSGADSIDSYFVAASSHEAGVFRAPRLTSLCPGSLVVQAIGAARPAPGLAVGRHDGELRAEVESAHTYLAVATREAGEGAVASSEWTYPGLRGFAGAIVLGASGTAGYGLDAYVIGSGLPDGWWDHDVAAALYETLDLRPDTVGLDAPVQAAGWVSSTPGLDGTGPQVTHCSYVVERESVGCASESELWPLSDEFCGPCPSGQPPNPCGQDPCDAVTEFAPYAYVFTGDVLPARETVQETFIGEQWSRAYVSFVGTRIEARLSTLITCTTAKELVGEGETENVQGPFDCMVCDPSDGTVKLLSEFDPPLGPVEVGVFGGVGVVGSGYPVERSWPGTFYSVALTFGHTYNGFDGLVVPEWCDAPEEDWPLLELESFGVGGQSVQFEASGGLLTAPYSAAGLMGHHGFVTSHPDHDPENGSYVVAITTVPQLNKTLRPQPIAGKTDYFGGGVSTEDCRYPYEVGVEVLQENKRLVVAGYGIRNVRARFCAAPGAGDACS